MHVSAGCFKRVPAFCRGAFGIRICTVNSKIQLGLNMNSRIRPSDVGITGDYSQVCKALYFNLTWFCGRMNRLELSRPAGEDGVTVPSLSCSAGPARRHPEPGPVAAALPKATVFCCF